MTTSLPNSSTKAFALQVSLCPTKEWLLLSPLLGTDSLACVLPPNTGCELQPDDHRVQELHRQPPCQTPSPRPLPCRSVCVQPKNSVTVITLARYRQLSLCASPEHWSSQARVTLTDSRQDHSSMTTEASNNVATITQGQSDKHEDWATRAATQRVERILRGLSTEITEVIKTININIDHQGAKSMFACLSLVES